MKNNRHRTLVLVDSGNIESGTKTASGNPICKAIRCHGWRGAKTDGYWLHLYDGEIWTLTLLPKAARAFLARFLKDKPCKSFRFELKHNPK